MPKFIITTLFLSTPFIAFAKIEYQLTTPIPGLSAGSNQDIGSYIATLFQFGLAIVGLIAFAMIVFNGVKYIMGAGNESLVGDAKTGIQQAILGVLLLLISVTILDTINPCILRTVNVWRDRDTIQQTCATSSYGFDNNDNNSDSTQRPEDEEIEFITREQNIRNNINQNGTQVGYSNNVFITGIESDNQLKRLISRPNGTYDVYRINEDGEWIKSESESGADIHNYNYGFADIGEKRSEIETNIRDYLLRETDRLYADRGIPIEEAGRDKEINPLILSVRKNYQYEGHRINGNITCHKITPQTATIKPYYKCTNISLVISDLRENPIISKRPPESTSILYIEFPEGNNRSERIIENAILEFVKPNINQ